jgi:hypothetical protein
MAEEVKDPNVQVTPPNEGENPSVKTYTEDEFKKAVEEASKETSTKVKRELSKTLGVNLFDENEFNTFIDSTKNKVDKKVVEEYEAKLKEYEPIKKQNEDLLFDNAILKQGITPENRDRVKKLASVELTEGVTIEDAINKVVNDFPMLKGKVKAGINLNDDYSQLDANERYIRQNYELDDNGRPIRPKRR